MVAGRLHSENGQPTLLPDCLNDEKRAAGIARQRRAIVEVEAAIHHTNAALRIASNTFPPGPPDRETGALDCGRAGRPVSREMNGRAAEPRMSAISAEAAIKAH